MFARFRWGVLCCSLFGTHDFWFFLGTFGSACVCVGWLGWSEELFFGLQIKAIGHIKGELLLVVVKKCRV